ncbi:SDR family oxidoreductase [Vagococcus vulneris]|uniref:3-oxoacyl-[acyl-carrier-protein] reductase n=1 Tax=Vagococcus vulneris TaxID=1977869 RepID=A0A429ZYQ2_9ENTE|nr:SDR family NAD(P)-dependent oxidoreductase [Vagococcus vulneris]RST99100.1 3-oxoacyl-[acyl-carrier-protein] reductase [Vagococcus vulneris]
MIDLRNKRIIVTGAGSGIGRATALKLAELGAIIGVIDISESSLDGIVRDIRANNGEAYYEIVDVSKEQELIDAIDSLVERMGGLEGLACNAGINGTWAPIETLSLEDWHKTMNTNLTSTFISLKASIPYLKENGGAIVITSSINGNRIYNNFGASAYSTSKAGQVALMKMAALELGRDNIRVNAVCPGAIDTAINSKTIIAKETEEVAIKVEFPEGERPLKEDTGQPDQVANTIAFLLSADSGNVSGTELYVDGAESLL